LSVTEQQFTGCRAP